MSDELPTTDEVRELFVYGAWERARNGCDDDENGAEFDRWLAEHDRQVLERVGQKIQDLEHTRSQVKAGIRGGRAVEWFEGYDTAVLDAALAAKADGSDVRGRR